MSCLVTTLVLNTKTGEVENKIHNVTDLVMALKYQTLNKNISLLLIIINLQTRYLMQGWNKKN